MSKIFRIDWYPHQAHADYSRMDAEEIGLMSQLINLMYIHEGPINNDPKWICRSIKNMGSAKCRNIINRLLKNKEISLTPDGKLLKNMVQNQLNTVAKRMKNDSYCGSIDGVLDIGIEQNQLLNNPPSISTSTSISKEKIYKKEFSDWYKLYPLKKARANAEKAYLKVRKNGASAEELIAAIEPYKANKPEWKDYMHPASWLNGECWKDEYETTEDGPDWDAFDREKE